VAPETRRPTGVADPLPQRKPGSSGLGKAERSAAVPETAAASPQQPAQAPAIASAERDDPVWMGWPDQRSLAEIHAVSGPGAGRVWPLGMGVHDIGSAPGNAIEISGNGVPERGLQVNIGPSGQAWLLLPGERTRGVAGMRALADNDAAGSLPIRIDVITPPDDEASPQPEAGKIPWPIGGDLVLGEVLLRITSPTVADAVIVRSADGLGYDYIRAPRTVPRLPEGRIRLPYPPPAVQPPSRISTAIVIAGIVVLGIGLASLPRSVFFWGFILILISLVLTGIKWMSEGRAERNAIWGGFKMYWEGRAAANAAIAKVIAQERELRCDTLMDPASAALTAIGPGRRLWERRRGDADHLVLRVGTLDQPSMIEVEDPSRADAQRIFRWDLPDVPLAVDVAARGVLGLVGEEAATRAMAGWMVVQAAVLHSPRELQICLLADGSAQALWDWVRQLPHARRGPAVLVGSDADSVEDCVGELVSVIRTRGGDGALSASSVVPGGPDIIVILDGARRFCDVDGMARILAEGPALRVFSICLDEEERFLPRECTGLVWCDPAAVAVTQQDLPDFTGIRPDLVTQAWCQRVAGSLAELRDRPMARHAPPARPGTRIPD
jgi:DNA segregation ATPase FtsK/SpoIIIE, S-DNA-T family